MRLLIIAFLAIFSVGCKAQMPSYVGASLAEPEMSIEDYVNWYSNLVESPKYDTVSVYQPPTVSNIRYVIIRPLNGGTLEVSRKSGARLGFVCGECQWVDQVTFNTKGEVIGGLQDVVLSGAKMVVQYERCEDCIFKQNASKL